MPTREQALRAYQERGDYGAAGRDLGVSAGQVYLVATGIPADGGDASAPEHRSRAGVLPGSTQHLVHGPGLPQNQVTEPHVQEWVRRRAAADTPMQQAAEARDATAGSHPAKRQGRAGHAPAAPAAGSGRTAPARPKARARKKSR